MPFEKYIKQVKNTLKTTYEVYNYLMYDRICQRKTKPKITYTSKYKICFVEVKFENGLTWFLACFRSKQKMKFTLK